MLTNEAIAEITGAPLKNVEATWPSVVEAMQAQGVWSQAAAVAVAATIAVETGVSYDADKDGTKDNMTFLPIRELGSEAYLNRAYDQRTDLGNTPEIDGDGALWRGRGLVQITGKANYQLAENEIPIPGLTGDPELALEPANAVAILLWFFTKHGIFAEAEAGHWRRVRKLVNGGTNGLERFMYLVGRLASRWQE